MLIRRIRPADNAAVVRLIRDVMTEYEAVGPGYSIEDPEIEAMYEAYSAPRSVFYVLEDNSAVMGCGGLAPLKGATPHICELQKMYFLQPVRGRGLGTLLGRTLIVDARRFGFTKMYIETLERMRVAQRLYEKLGFRRIEQGLGDTGHCGCDVFLEMDIEPQEIDPSLLA